ncbi:hypothetical protein M758_2G176400 [Ceratodon purpureus]|nr:hypothetical protein M758_2G176400 [Ceratodon purpureus]
MSSAHITTSCFLKTHPGTSYLCSIANQKLHMELPIKPSPPDRATLTTMSPPSFPFSLGTC